VLRKRGPRFPRLKKGTLSETESRAGGEGCGRNGSTATATWQSRTQEKVSAARHNGARDSGGIEGATAK
jgi:hypothetical protein